MIKAKKVFTIILSFALLAISSHACYGYNKLDLVKTDNIILRRSDIRQQQNCYPIFIDFDVPTNGFQAALSVSNFHSLKTSQGYDYTVRGTKKRIQNVLLISILFNQISQWTQLSISYIVSARNDLFINSYLFDSYAQFDCTSNRIDRQLNFSVAIYGVPQNAKYEARVFISGLKTKDPSFNFAFRNANFNSLNGVLSINAITNASPFIEFIYISYIIYRVNYDYEINFVPTSVVKDEDYVFYFTNSCVKSGAQFLALTLNTDKLKCIGWGCKNSCYTTQQCKAAGGQKYGRVCYLCGAYQRLQNWQCVPNCRLEFENYDPQSGLCTCKPGFTRTLPNQPCRPTCSLNQIWDGRCICKPGCGRHGGGCIVCPIYSKAVGQQCVCDIGYYWNARKSICQANFCPPNSSPYEGAANVWQCKCNNPYQYYNPQRKICEYVAQCPPNSKLELVYNQVSKFKQWSCVCNQGLFWNSKTRACDYLAACGQYAYPSFNGNQWICVCKSNCYSVGKICKPYPVCPPGTKFNNFKEQCECLNPGQYYFNGICRSCGKYEEFNVQLKKFVCINGYSYINGLCSRQCSEYEDRVGDNCVCKPSCYYNRQRCTPCPAYSRPNADRTLCVCDQGYVSQNGLCIPKRLTDCLQGMERLPNGQCNCNGYIQAGRCRQIPKCPIKSKWNQQKLRCQCSVVGQYLIDNVCQSCKQYQSWNGKQCACVTGYFKINGVCRICDSNSYYNNKQCVCNLGFYGNPLQKCHKCHSSCGRCLGPKEDQCTMCSDVSYQLQKGPGGCGVCSRNSTCPVGLYRQKGQCKPCSSYCSQCQSQSICNTCIPGFQINQMQYNKQVYAYCVQICGDGKRFQLDCDDGNNINGDGCSSQCQVEKSWHCQGGSSIKASTCVPYSPSRSFITLTGTVHLFGKVVQGVRLSYIPPALTANDCMDCHKLLWVRVISSTVVPGVRVNYLPKSQYQFLTQFDFNGLFAIPVFTISIQINPDFAKYFSDADLAQIQVKAIDPAVLAKADVAQQLSLDDEGQTNDKIASAVSHNKQLLDVLFPKK